MSVTLKKLTGARIPNAYRTQNRNVVYKVVGENGDEFIYVDGVKAAAKVVELTEASKQA